MTPTGTERERGERNSLRERIAAHYARYPHPKTGAVLSPDSLSRNRLGEILAGDAGGDWSAVGDLLELAVDGYVARHGLAVHEHSGWDPWDHFELASVASSAKLAQNVAAGAAARDLGNRPPLRRRDHVRRRRAPSPERERRKRDQAAAEEARQREDLERLRKMSPDELQALEVSIWENAPPSAFRDQRLAKARRALELGLEVIEGGSDG